MTCAGFRAPTAPEFAFTFGVLGELRGQCAESTGVMGWPITTSGGHPVAGHTRQSTSSARSTSGASSGCVVMSGLTAAAPRGHR
jgi:hypothetical protein